MFTRVITTRVKANHVSLFNDAVQRKIVPILQKQKGFRQILTLTNPDCCEVIGITFWESREQAESYGTISFSDILQELTPITEGTPLVQTYDVSLSTVQGIAAREDRSLYT